MQIQIEQSKLERIISQSLRDEAKLLPERANAIAADIAKRVICSMPTPTAPALRGDRIISRHMRHESDFIEQLQRRFLDADYRTAQALWNLVYDQCRNLPLIHNAGYKDDS